ncbi:unnamed protein product [Lathyrus oleraceus]|uniref:Protein kinase domain-containing protein n=2 Tax=Pisum sativum TaxID=3888 RepID=A0A9D5BHG7_PEA|nr:serine/threonine-protein kinase STE20-like [Pisum sativum]KAI5443759.1 hypothetical protein KIW84_012419 [Pisum sativum]
MALNKTGNLLGTNSGNKHGLFPQYNEQESHSGVTNVHNNSNKKDIPKEVGRVFALPDVSQDRENRFGLNRENGHVRYEDLTNILGLKRMDSESFSDIGDFIAKKQPPAQEMKNGISAYILSKGQKGDNNNGDHGALRKTFSESISEQIDTRLAVLSPVYVHKRSHSNGFSSSGILEDSLSGGKMKFLCSFGGKILPRPGDGKLRYVGGETHIISIQKDISWEELMNKTLRICSHPHTIKYQLPGEDLDALISVSSDEDLQNMIEEYYELESHEGSQKLRIFLVPLGESEETSPTDANTVLQNDPDYQYVVALNGIVDHSPKKNIGGQSLTTEAYHSTTSFSFAPTIASSPKEIRDGNNSMSALNPDRILNDPVNLQSPLRISPTPVQVASSSTGYIQLLGSNSCQGSIDSNASFVTAQMNSGNSSINTADCRYPQQASVPRQHGDIGPPKNLNGQYFDNRNPNNCYSDEVFGGTLHNDRIFFSRNPISQQTESYGTKNELPHGMPHAFSDSQLYPSGAKSIYCSQEGISPSFSLNLEKAELSLTVGVSHVNLIEGQHDPFLHHPQIQSKIPNKESAEMHRRQGVASSSPYSESVGTNDRINKDSILTEKKYLVAQTDLSGSNFVEKDVLENPLKSERMMINEEKNPISKDNNVYEGNPTVNYMSELHLLDTFPTNNISANIGMQYNWDQPRENTLPSSSGTTGLSLNNLVDKTPSDLLDIGQNTSYSRNINFPARNINLNSPISEYAENSRDKSSVRDDMFNFSFDPHSLKSAQIQPSQNQIATGFHDNPTINSESSNPAVLHDDVCPSLILPVDSLDSSRNNVSFKKPPSFLNDFITNTDQMVDQFKHEYSASGLSKVEGEILGRLKNSERSNDSKLVESFAVAEDATGVVPSNRKSSPVHPPHNFDEVGSDVSPSQTEVESTIPESDPEDYKDDQTDMNDFLSDAMIAEMEASIYGLQIIRNTDLEELMELGSGTYGTVYHGKWRGTDVAIKRIKKSCFGGRSSEQERLAKDFWREAQILSNLHHPNVLAFYGIVPDGACGTLATVTEYMVNGSLRHVLVKNNRLLDRRKKLIIAMDAAFGMEYLHSKNIVHFDLKCDNLLVNLRDPQRPICKVGDFGLSRIKRNTLVSGGVRGTLPWMAPELLNGNSSRVSEKVDVFSFGISMWELLTGEEPYADMHCGAIIGGIVKNTLRPPIPERCDPEWRKLMEECWSRDPEYRPSFTEITSRLRSMSMALQGKGDYQAWQLRPSNVP